ncbi:acyl carrier protein [Coraliomargarita sp. W4R72]
MKIEQFVSVFVGALDDVDPTQVTATTAFKELPGWDSLAVLTVTDTIDMDFGVLLSKVNFGESETVQDLYEIVKSKQP